MMNFLPVLWRAGWVAFLFFLGSGAHAAINISSATVNGGATTTVLPGATISVVVNVTITSGTDWRSTSWRIGSGTVNCVNHANHDSNGSYSETLTITAPTVEATYDLSLVASNNNSCNGTTDTYALNNSIVVSQPPTVLSINRLTTSPTAESSVEWTVNFSESVTGVDASDFLLVQGGGLSGASIASVSGSGATWTVTASTGTGAGTLGLNLVDDDSVRDAASNRLGGTGVGNGNFTGQAYSILVPLVSSISRASFNPNTGNASVAWNVAFNTSVTGMDVADFVLVQAGGTTGASITSVTGSGANWSVTAHTGTSNTGTLGLNLVDDDSIVRPINTPLGGNGAGNGNFAGEVYTLQPPVVILSKTSSASSADLGDVVSFTITATNPYSVPMTDVAMNDGLPEGMGYSTHVATLGTVNVAGQNISWTIPSLPAGGSAQLTLAVSLSKTGTLTNTVTSPGAVSASATILVLANAITHFRLDEPVDSWSGAAGEVIDSGGTALHGRRVTTTAPTITNTETPSPTIHSEHSSVVGEFCNAGKFDGRAVVQVADSPSFDYTTQLSASAWIYPTAYPTSDYSSILSNDVNYEFHLSPTGKLYWWWNSSTLTSAASIPLNQWTHVAITFNSTPGVRRQRIYINGVADTNTNNWTGALAPNPCPFYIGGDVSTGSGCALMPARNFRGKIDEVKLYNFELGAAEVQADMNLGRSCAGTFDHIRIEHDGIASICAPETVTVKACFDAACSTLYAGNVTVRLSPTGWNGGDTFTFSGGVTSRQLSHGTAENVILGTVSVAPIPANATRCDRGGTENCTMNFAMASCSFDAVETGANPQTRLFTKLSGVPFNVDVLALSTPTTINTNYTGTVSVDLVDASSSACPAGAGLNAATSITYVGGNNGRKAVALTYPDAARNVRVRARVGATSPACSSDSFTIRPQGFSNVYSSANASYTGTDVAADSTATPVVKAGAVFTIGADTGVAGYNGSPKANAGLIEWPNVPAGGRVAPGTGILAGILAGELTFTTAANAASGNGASGNFTYDDVGYFRFGVNGVYDNTFPTDSGDIANGDCVINSFANTAIGGKFGCNFGNASVSNHFGRFIPDHFDTEVAEACVPGSFSYSGQPFPLTVTARNFAGGAAQNYIGTFAKQVTLVARDSADTIDNPGPGTLFPAIVLPADFTAGVASQTPTYTFTSRQTVQTGVRVRASDTEATSLRDPATLSKEGTANVRSGRARLSNAYGSESLDLPVIFRTEYWNGSGWILNTADSCTGDETSDAANEVKLLLVSTPVNLTCVLDSGNPGLSKAGCAAAAGVARRYREGATPALIPKFAGDFNLWLQAPQASGVTTINATVPGWLGTVPAARARFGIYKSPLIYRRENY